MHLPLVARSLTIALIVGTILTAINQGNVIVQGDATLALAWKIPLTYAVPYCVATAGAILNARSKTAPTGGLD
ncbi:MAG: nitrate/nitrite transporter NrtS [Chloroflexi bacterium]|nr:nitrate/nitrite transporter NrtS [Chloroflexota bacterium]